MIVDYKERIDEETDATESSPHQPGWRQRERKMRGEADIILFNQPLVDLL